MLKKAGYSVTDACITIGISRSCYYSRKKRETKNSLPNSKYEDLILKIKDIKSKHPYWGYRRVTAWLNHREGLNVNHKRVYRIMKENGLLVNLPVHKAKRTAQRNKPRAERPRQYWGIDMTKFIVPSIGWVYLVIVLDWYTKKIVGWTLSLRGRSSDKDFLTYIDKNPSKNLLFLEKR